MNDYNNQNRDIDLVDFSSGEMSRIREAERLERENRQKKAMQMRRAEMIRRKKLMQIKQTVFAWSVVVMAVIVLVAIIVGVVSLIPKEKKSEPQKIGDKVSAEQMTLVSDFEKETDAFYLKTEGTENVIYVALEKAVKDLSAPANLSQDDVVQGCDLSMITNAYMWNGGISDKDRIKQLVRDYPIYTNGYVWSSEKKMTSPVTASFLYDTNASYISAVCEICMWEGNGDFLDAVDATAEDKGDISNTMKVGEKLDKAVSHFFDVPDYSNPGGVRYNEEDGLVYVHTPENDGTEKGVPSNAFLGYRFGYVDTYINLSFNKAMQDLEALYTLLGDKDKAEQYAGYAEKNRTAVNNRLYDNETGRYVACIDKDGKTHDNGFTVINLMAVSFNMADKAQKESILSWIEGKRLVNSDDTKGKDILKNGLIPVFTTVEEDGTWWYMRNEYPLADKAMFGKFWLNGAPSALSGYYYMTASGEKQLVKRAGNVLSMYDNGNYEKVIGSNDEPKLYSDLLLSGAIKAVLGISAGERTLTVNPNVETDGGFGVKNIAFSDNVYGFLFDGNNTYVTAEKNEAVKLKIGGYPSLAKVTMTVVSDDEIILTKELTAGADGTVILSQKFGYDTYLKLQEIPIDK